MNDVWIYQEWQTWHSNNSGGKKAFHKHGQTTYAGWPVDFKRLESRIKAGKDRDGEGFSPLALPKIKAE
jgi:hypothetical protein